MIYVEKLTNGLKRLNRVPRYSAANHVTGWRSTGEREWEEPEGVWAHGRHSFVRGKVDIREVPPAYATDLEAIDAERKSLRQRLAQLDADETQVLQLAWAASKNLTKEEVVRLTADDDARRAAAKATA